MTCQQENELILKMHFEKVLEGVSKALTFLFLLFLLNCLSETDHLFLIPLPHLIPHLYIYDHEIC